MSETLGPGDTGFLVPVGPGDFLIVSGGSAISSTVAFGGQLFVSSGGSVLDTALGGYEYLSAGGTATSTSVNSGGFELVQSGGTAIESVLNFAGDQAVYSGGTAIGTTVNSGGQEIAYNSGTTSDTLVQNGGVEVVFSGGTASGTTVADGGLLNVSSGGSTTGTVVGSNGAETVNSGATAVDTTVGSGGFAIIATGATATGTTVEAGGILIVLPGSTVTQTTGAVVSTGVVVIQSGTQVLQHTSVTNGTVVGNAVTEFVFAGGSATATVMDAGGVDNVYSGGTAIGAIVNSGGSQNVSSGGTTSGTAVDRLGFQYVSAGGVASSTQVNNSGVMEVFNSGTADFAVVSGGGLDIVSSGGTASGTLLSGGNENVSSGGTSIGTVVRGGNEVVYGGGTATGAVLSNGGQAVILLGGTTSFTTVSNGGTELVAFGTVTSTTVSNGGIEKVFATGTASGTMVNSGGTETVFAGGTIVGVTINGGSLEIQNGGVQDQGAITFAGSGIVTIDAGTPSSVISGFGNGDTVDFAALAPGLVTAIPIGGNTVIGGVTFAGIFPASGPGSLVLGTDGAFGTDVTIVPLPTVSQGQGSKLSIAATSTTKAEGNSGSTPFTFTVTRSGVVTAASSVNWAVAGVGGLPANAADFTGGVLPSGTINFAAGQTSATITVGVAGDTTVEYDERFTVTLSGAGGALVTTPSAIGTIQNDDTGLAISALSATKPEGNSGTTPFTFTVSRSGVTTGASSATWTVGGVGGLPANAADFTGGVLPSGTVSFAAGQTSQTIAVGVAGDTAVESDERFTVTLSGAAGATIVTPSAVGTIQNDDTGLAITALSATKAEGNSGTTPFTFTVTRAGLLTGASSAHWVVAGFGGLPANAADFTGGVLPSGTVSFASGQASQTITVGVAGDAAVEYDERFSVTLSGAAGASITTASAVGTIQNDDTSLAISPLSVTKPEGNSGTTPFTFTVTRAGLTTGATSVNWTVAGFGGLAANAADFTGGVLPSGTVNFAPGQASQTISVGVAGDTAVEYDERFSVTLSAPAGATITTPSAVGTIQNDDTALAISPLSVTKPEGNSGTTPFTFTVSRTGLLTGASSATWTVAGVGGLPANAADFTGGVLPSGTINFAAGQTSQIITVGVAGDTTAEFDERFNVTLSGAAGATITTASAVGTIQNDDTGLAINALSATKPEGNSGTTPFTFTVARSGLLTSSSSASWSVAGSGVAPANATDFAGGVLPSGTVNFAPGQTSQTITVGVAGDTTVQPDEGFTVALSGATGATIGTASANGLIMTDDPVTSTQANATLPSTAGNDLFLIGGGNDAVTGGGGVDRFLFAKNAIGPAATHTVTVSDFNPGLGEVLNLSAIDAIAGAVPDAPFHFVGTAAFSDHAGELRWTDLGSQRLIQGDVNGDGTADLTIFTSAPGPVTSQWFVL